MDQFEIFQFSRPSTPSNDNRQVAPASSSSRKASSSSPVPRRANNSNDLHRNTFSPGGPLPRTTLSVVEWGNGAPLDEQEVSSVAVVTNAFKERPLPAKFRKPDLASTGYQLAAATTVTEAADTPPLAASIASLSDRQQQQITTVQQFHEHFSHLTSTLLHNQDATFRAHLAQLSDFSQGCETLRSELDDAESLVNKMIESLQWVEDRGESLRIAGEDLMQEEAQLNLQTQHIASRLEYFTFLEQAQRTLNYPGDDLVLSEGFLSMVDRLDSCLQYLRLHSDFKDAEIYLIRYQQCMTRSMVLIKLYFCNTIRGLGQEVSKRLNDKTSETAQIALLYQKFTSLAFPLRPLLAELELRAEQNPKELSSLLNECHSTWISVRKTLVNPRVEAEIKRMQPWSNHHDLVDLVRSGCSYLKQACTDEYSLFKQFFQTGDETIYRYLSALCDNLYDHLRPQILHASSLTTLDEVCTVLQALMVQVDLDDDNNEELQPLSSPQRLARVSSYDADVVIQPHRPRLRVEDLLRVLLQDAQTRLVFRSELVIKEDVEAYQPRTQDLDYPSKIKKATVDLKAQRNAIAVSLDHEDDDEPAYFALPSQETQETWYPALRTTLWVLSSLHTYIEYGTFQEIAHEAISACRKSLGEAATVLAQLPDHKPLDGQLFLIRHLLILKEMTANVESARPHPVEDRPSTYVREC